MAKAKPGKPTSTPKKGPPGKPSGKGPKGPPGKTGTASAGDGWGAKGSDSWNEARNAKVDDFSINLPVGNYVGQLTKAGFGNSNGNDWVRFELTVLSGEVDGQEGEVVGLFHYIAESEFEKNGKKIVQTIAEKQERLARDIQRLGYDSSELRWSEIPALCQQMQKDQNEVRFAIKKSAAGNAYVQLKGMVEEGDD
jgi:hypothetical protein